MSETPTISPNNLAQLLAKHKVVDESAVYDPDGYDSHRTLDLIYAVARELNESLRSVPAPDQPAKQ